jgi:hypothetical protein
MVGVTFAVAFLREDGKELRRIHPSRPRCAT